MRRCISAGGSTEIVHDAMPVSVRQLFAGSAGCVGAPCQTRSATSRWESVAKMRPLPPSSTGGTDWSGSHTVTIAFVSNGAMHCRNASALGRRRAASRTASLGTASPDRSPGGGRRFLPLPLGVLVVRLPPRALCVADARGLRRAWVGRGSPSISTGTLRQQAPSAKKDAARARRGFAAHACIEGVRRQRASGSTCMQKH